MPPGDRSVARPIRTAIDAEQTARDWMRYLGFPDSRLTNQGADGGVDVRSSNAVAQVKKELSPTGRPKLQELYGIAAHEGSQALFFTLAGYTPQALEWGTQAGIALFRLDYSGDIIPENIPARRLIQNKALLTSGFDAFLAVVNSPPLERETVAEDIRSAYSRIMDEGNPTIASKAAVEFARFLLLIGDAEGARAPIAWALDAGSEDYRPIAQVKLGVTLEQQGDIAAARDAYEQAIRSAHPDATPEAARQLGIMLESRGDIMGAREAYSKAAASGHEEWAPDALQRLGSLEADEGNLAEARAAYEQAIRSADPETAHWAIIELGTLLAKHGDLHGAETLYRRELTGGSLQHRQEIALYLIDLLAGQGQFTAVRHVYRKMWGSMDVPEAFLKPEAKLHQITEAAPQLDGSASSIRSVMGGRELPPPGWFPDSGNPDQWRWWNGSAWTDHSAPKGPAE
jgi:tetratricopeptide (TPR) repeat protein